MLLDEPTNHLDMEGKEELAETLREFAGAVMLVTHDRMLIENSCNRFWLIDHQQLEEWQDLEPVYARLAEQRGAEPQAARQTVPGDSEGLQHDEERLLACLFELEAKLQEDLARKTRHQKPALQRQWRNEIAEITVRLKLD
ncbi:putative ABC transporter ATP-binding protein [compost metagenome]